MNICAQKNFHSAYELIEKIGEGGFGSVFKVRRRSDGTFFASKEIDYANFSTTKKKLITFETELLATLHHPSIASLIELYDDTEREVLYIVMELFDRGDLKKLIKTMRVQLLCVSEAQIWLFLEQALSALYYMHEGKMDPVFRRKIIHRDIKPDNIVVTQDGHIKLIDFGICKELIDCSVTHTRCGTSQYAAPEIFVRRPSYDERIDVWALGCVAYELAAAKALFQADTTSGSTITETPKIDLPSFSPLLSQFISWMLVVEPESRPTAGQLLAFLRNLRIRKEPLRPRKFARAICNPPNYLFPGQRLDARLNHHDRMELQVMAASGQTSSVKEHIITSVRCVDNNGRTALHIAAAANKKFVVKALLPYEAGMLDNNGDTALSIAVRKESTETVNLLAPIEAFASISKGEGANNTDEFGLTPLMWAAIMDDVGTVHVCIQEKLYLKVQSKDGMTALMYAAQANNLLCCKMILEIEEGMQTPTGETALFFAISEDYGEIIDLLFDREISISLEAEANGKSQHTLLEIASFIGNMTVITRLLPHYSAVTYKNPMLYSVLGQRVEAAALLQLKKCDALTDELRYLSTAMLQLYKEDPPA